MSSQLNEPHSGIIVTAIAIKCYEDDSKWNRYTKGSLGSSVGCGTSTIPSNDLRFSVELFSRSSIFSVEPLLRSADLRRRAALMVIFSIGSSHVILISDILPRPHDSALLVRKTVLTDSCTSAISTSLVCPLTWIPNLAGLPCYLPLLAFRDIADTETAI